MVYYNIIYLISDGSVTGTRGGYPLLQNRDPDLWRFFPTDDLDPRVQVPTGILTDLPVGTRDWSGLVLSLMNHSLFPNLLVRLHNLSHSLRHLICPLKWQQSKDCRNVVPIAIELPYHRRYPLNHHLKRRLYQCLPNGPRVRPIRSLAPKPVRIRWKWLCSG